MEGKPIPALDQPTEVLERASLLRRAGGDRELFNELLGLLRINCPEELANIRGAIAAGNAQQLERSAHSLKGVLQNFMRGRLVALAYQLELIGREGRLEAAPTGLAELESEYQAAGPQFEELQRLAE